ncbi:hypothetical protein Cgig2_013814 [Carnegiea gigantea]|uniref:Phosphatidate cytidylyltransferase, mitochondrial n=1 Tax=Carnegiea gigantea TaxID=171969 RepID=A0A9Q1GS19_9CARY|nr:hypothetical protein Cgig2_013814 [Carnegiea gigantea]
MFDVWAAEKLNVAVHLKDCGLPAAETLVSCLPKSVRSYVGMSLGEQQSMNTGSVHEVVIKSRAEAANCVEKFVRRKVMVSSARQAVSGLLTVGIGRASRYLANKNMASCTPWENGTHFKISSIMHFAHMVVHVAYPRFDPIDNMMRHVSLCTPKYDCSESEEIPGCRPFCPSRLDKQSQVLKDWKQ